MSPRRSPIDYTRKMSELLSLLDQGSLAQDELPRKLGISASRVSMLLDSSVPEIVRWSVGRKKWIGKLLVTPGLENPMDFFEVKEAGQILRAGSIALLSGNGVLESLNGAEGTKFHGNGMEILEERRPLGFLGRLSIRHHAPLGLGSDARLWTLESLFRYLQFCSSDGPGNLVFGSVSFGKLQSERVTLQSWLPEHPLPKSLEDWRAFSANMGAERTYFGEQLKQEIWESAIAAHLEFGAPGSSVGGEQPKFLACSLESTSDGVHKSEWIVKYAKKSTTEESHRRQDLLRCEHHALNCLAKNGVSASESILSESNEYIFLQLKRFDRTKTQGRSDVVSLGTLSAFRLGVAEAPWSKRCRELLSMRVISKTLFEQVCLLEAFGILILNKDMHLWNLAFFWENGKIQALTPVFDMCPMAILPHNGIVPTLEKLSAPVAQGPLHLEVWDQARNLAGAFWTDVKADPKISPQIRELAALHAKRNQSA